MVTLKVELYHKILRVVKLDIGFHHRCLDSEQEVSPSGEASDGASPWESQGGGIHDGAPP